MAKARKLKSPMVWTEVKDAHGVLLGHYASDDGMIVVKSVEGWEKRTQIGNPKALASLARLMLSEGPP